MLFLLKCSAGFYASSAFFGARQLAAASKLERRVEVCLHAHSQSVILRPVVWAEGSQSIRHKCHSTAS